MTISILTAVLFFVFSEVENTANQEIIEVSIKEIASTNGSVYVAIYQEDNWMEEPTAGIILSIKENRTATGSFEGLPPGRYGISIFHDENDNGVLDKGRWGIPKEAYAFSNNAKGLMGPASFESASFEFDGSQKTIQLKF